MPLIPSQPPSFKPRKKVTATWKSFRKGLNLLLRPTELSREEYAVGDNIMLTGSGVPTGRWGSTQYFVANATGSIRGIGSFVNNASGVNEVLAVSDQGYLVKKNNLSSTVISGLSFPSGTSVRFAQLGGYTYVVSEDTPMAQYDGTLAVFATISPPTALMASNVSGVTGTTTYSWKLTALGATAGETNPSVAITLGNLPQDLTRTMVRITWSMPSAATIGSFQIYRGLPGSETFLTGVGPGVREYLDVGDAASETRLAPLANTTGGLKSPIIAKYNDRLLFVDAEDKTKLIITGRYPNQSKTSWYDGGGYIYIDPKSGDEITGIGIQPGSNKIVVYKNESQYEVTLSTVSLGNFTVLDPQYQPISTGIGCSNPDTIQIVENDIFYFGRKGLYVTGYEPNFLSIIRTNEISARLRPYLALLGEDDYQNACAMYVNNKYLLSFPARNEMIVYDRERGAFAGLWKLPFGITKMLRHTDSSGTERWIIGSGSSNTVYTFEPSLSTDDGTAIAKTFRTNKEAFTSWTDLKTFLLFHILFRNVTGSVQVNILMEDRNGSTSTIKSYSIEGTAIAGNSGWGTSLWGSKQWGDTSGSISVSGDEIPQWGKLFKTGRFVQVEVAADQADSTNSNFELLGIEFIAQPQTSGALDSNLRV